VRLFPSAGDSIKTHTVSAWNFSCEYSWEISTSAPRKHATKVEMGFSKSRGKSRNSGRCVILISIMVSACVMVLFLSVGYRRYFMKNRRVGLETDKTDAELDACFYQILGCCHDKGELLLVYGYLPNHRSLDIYLFEEQKTNRLDWDRRYSIACDKDSDLVYLREELDQPVVHRDVKASNVSPEGDVFSFGALALEISCIRRPIEQPLFEDSFRLVE
ncbi:hypothetical protein KI387_008583, partial [Taxus chinensis]